MLRESTFRAFSRTILKKKTQISRSNTCQNDSWTDGGVRSVYLVCECEVHNKMTSLATVDYL